MPADALPFPPRGRFVLTPPNPPPPTQPRAESPPPRPLLGPAPANAPAALVHRRADWCAGWEALLWDLGALQALGEVWVESASPALTLRHRTRLSSLAVQADVGHLQGADHALRLLLERARALRGTGLGGVWQGAALCIEGRDRKPVLTLRPAGGADPTHFILRALLAAHGGVNRGIQPARQLVRTPVGLRPRRAARVVALGPAQAHPAARLGARCAGLDDDLDLTDMAELCGLLRLDPHRLRQRGPVQQADPGLIPVLLEALCEQVVPLRLITGNDALIRRVDLSPCASTGGAGGLWLRGEHCSLQLDLAAIATALVVQRSDRVLPRREVRLYDQGGRALLIFTAASDGAAVPSVWRSLVDALMP